MNSAVITKIEYQLKGELEFSPLEVIPHSGKLVEDVERTRAGNLHKSNVQFSMARVSAETDSALLILENRQAKFRITDANNAVHLVGSDNYSARMAYQKVLDGNPGSFNGYRCTITCNSPTGSSVS